MSLKNKSILLIITGSIASYKCADLTRRLKEEGATVRCIMTKSATEFITPLLMSSLSEEETYTDLFSLKDETEMGHIRLSREADLLLVAPATANILGKMAYGVCDDLASTVLMATDKPVITVPAMNPMMWENTATQENISTLQDRGIQVLNPNTGNMACGEVGAGRMAEVSEIIDHLKSFFDLRDALKGKRAVVTAGPTYEAIDPVRFIGNHSSGKQGYAIAQALAMAGAETTLITGPCAEKPPSNVHIKKIMSADEMMDATLDALPADIVVCAAAVADWKPVNVAKDKMKKTNAKPQIELTENKDILKTIAGLTKNRPQLVIGFAAETTNIKEYAEKKLLKKKCDWILANDVAPKTGTFGGDENTIHFLQLKDKKVIETNWPKMSKKEVALKLIHQIIQAF